MLSAKCVSAIVTRPVHMIMQGVQRIHLDALASVPPTLKDFEYRNEQLSAAEWAMMSEEVQLDALVINELSLAALNHLSDARYIAAGSVTEEAAAHLPTKTPYLVMLHVAQFPRDMVMRLSCMPDLEEIDIKKGQESAINLSEGFPALHRICITFVGKCKRFNSPGVHIANATKIDMQFTYGH